MIAGRGRYAILPHPIFSRFTPNRNFESLKAFRFLNFFRLSFFYFSFLFATVIGLLLGLLVVKKLLRTRHRDTMEQPPLVAGNLAVSFSLNFWSIFVHISGTIRPITLIWVLLERSFPCASVEFR